MVLKVAAHAMLRPEYRGEIHPRGNQRVEAVRQVGGDGSGMGKQRDAPPFERSEEHTSELQSLMRISYAVFCLKKKNITLEEDKHSILTIKQTQKSHKTKTNKNN